MYAFAPTRTKKLRREFACCLCPHNQVEQHEAIIGQIAPNASRRCLLTDQCLSRKWTTLKPSFPTWPWVPPTQCHPEFLPHNAMPFDPGPSGHDTLNSAVNSQQRNDKKHLLQGHILNYEITGAIFSIWYFCGKQNAIFSLVLLFHTVVQIFVRWEPLATIKLL